MMLLVSFFYLISSIDYVCSSPLAHAPPPKGAKLISVSLFLRHGIRTPSNEWLHGDELGQWYCDSEDSYSPRYYFSTVDNASRRYFNQMDYKLMKFPPVGDLLIQGMEQHYELGKYMQKYYGEELRFIPKLLNRSLLGLRSSFIERTFRSGEAFMEGLYPPAVPNELIEFETGTQTTDPLYVLTNNCEELNEDYNVFVKSEEFIRRRDNAKVLYAPIYEKNNRKFDGFDWLFVGDFIASYICSGNALPSYVTDEMIVQSRKDIAFLSYGLFNITKGRAASPVLREYFRNTDQQLEGKTDKRFWLYSAHDTTIISLLELFGNYDDALPPFRSHLAIEIWEKSDGKKYVRFDYNGDLVKFDIFNGKTFVEYNEFKKKLQPYLNYCKEFE